MINRTVAGQITPDDLGKLITFRALQDTYITGPLANFRTTDDGEVAISIKGINNGVKEERSMGYYFPEHFWFLDKKQWVRIDDSWNEVE